VAKKKTPFLKSVKKEILKYIKKPLKFITYKGLLPLVYYWYAKKPINENLILFADQRYTTMPDNFKDIYARCKKDGYHCVLMLLPEDLVRGKSRNWKKRIQKWRFNFEFLKTWAQSRIVFLVEYFPMLYVAKMRPETQVIQLWHGCGAMKMFGYSTINKPWGPSLKQLKRYPTHINYSLVCVSGQKAIAPFEDAFPHSPGAVKAMGVPRTDIYFNEEFVKNARENILKVFPEIGRRKIILYAPTFRGNTIRGSHMELNLDIKTLKKDLSDDYVLLLKFHPLTAKKGIPESKRLSFGTFAFNGSDCITAEEALCAADILITDYSSIMFEYLLLERPIISYIYDIDKYIKDRGFYFPYDEMVPGPYVFNQEELVEKIQTVSQWFDIEKTRKYRQEYMSACDGHSTERIYNYVFGRGRKP